MDDFDFSANVFVMSLYYIEYIIPTILLIQTQAHAY